MASVDLARINTNVGAINMLSTLKAVNKEMALHQTRIATGKRINEAADDPGGMTLGLKMEKHTNHLQTAIDNIGDGKNLLSVAEGGLKKVGDILGKMRVKAEQAANDTLGTDERTAIKKDLDQYALEIDDIVKSTTWNGKKLLDGLQNTTDWSGGQITLQTGVSTVETTTLKAADLQSVSVSSMFGSTSTWVVASASISTGNAVGPTGFAGFSLATTAVPGSLSSLSELASGTYTMVVSVSTAGAAGGGTLSILDSSGNAISIATGTSSATSIALDLSNTTFAYDTGRGIKFNTTNLATSMATGGAYRETLTYAQSAGSYNFAVTTSTLARGLMDALDTQITNVSVRMQNLGALQSRLDFKTENLTTAKVNTQAAYSRLMDADMAEEQLGATRGSILQQTATSMLAQANQSGQSVMQLFR